MCSQREGFCEGELGSGGGVEGVCVLTTCSGWARVVGPGARAGGADTVHIA